MALRSAAGGERAATHRPLPLPGLGAPSGAPFFSPPAQFRGALVPTRFKESLTERSLVPSARAGRRDAASSVSPVSSGYERDAASLPRTTHRTPTTKRHSVRGSNWSAALLAGRSQPRGELGRRHRATEVIPLRHVAAERDEPTP